MTSRRALPVLVLALAAAAMALELVAFWPGIMVWDAIRQYGQALSGRYDDWHPPAMNWFWRQLGLFGPGPAPMLVVQAAGYWGGFALLVIAARRRSAAWGTALCALLPVPLWLVGTILKDAQMEAALLLAAGLLATVARACEGNEGDRVAGRLISLQLRNEIARTLAALLLLAAATLRFNAAPACLPLLLAALPARWRRTRARLALTAIGALVPLLVAMPIANRALHAGKSGVELSLVLYDLGGITHFSGAEVLPRVAPDQTATIARCWNPVSWDSYAWWSPAPCPIGFAALRPALGNHAYGWWLAGVAHHPLAYAAHRLAHVDRNLRLWVHDRDLPLLSLQSDPNDWGYRVPPSRLRDALAAYAIWATDTPLAWPAPWLALAVGLLIAVPLRGEERDLARPLLWSATLYGLSYVPLSVASEVRYHAWTISAAAIGAAWLIRRGVFAGVPKWRITLGAVLPVATLAISIAARLV